jgi:hypothetical protein
MRSAPLPINREIAMSEQKLIRVDRHLYHHHRRPPAKKIYVPVERTTYVPQPCERPHRSGLGTALMVVGGLTLLGLLFGSGSEK